MLFSKLAPRSYSVRQQTARSRRRHGLTLESLEPRVVLAASAIITEFQASNTTTLQDEDGEYSDWIEIHNETNDPLDLAGWSLTDSDTDLSKWTFPSVTLEPNEYLVVFASNKDRIDPASELHTNFRLSAGGEYLALVEPDGFTIATAFTPEFPPQVENGSYGFAIDRDTVRLVTEEDAVKAFVPSNDSLGTSWTQVGFNDSSWLSGTQAVGYE